MQLIKKQGIFSLKHFTELLLQMIFFIKLILLTITCVLFVTWKLRLWSIFFIIVILLRIFGKMFLNGSSLRMNAMSLSQKNIFFSVSILITPALAINYIILLGKQFIYTSDHPSLAVRGDSVS